MSYEPNYVKADGSLHARLVLIGEAPGRQENLNRKPFVGASGFKLADWWGEVGLRRTDFWIDNVYPYQPPGNNILTVPAADLAWWANNLHERIAELDDPWLIAPTGNVALRVLMRRDIYDNTVKITNYRGSIMEYVDNRGRRIKMIPTIHPASIFHTKNKSQDKNPGRIEKHCRLDWRRIAHEATFREVNLPQKEYRINPTSAELREFCDAVTRDAKVMSVDIETPSGIDISCVGFAYEPNWSLTIPLHHQAGIAADPEHYHAIRYLCELAHVEKILQNGTFDATWLWKTEGIWLTNYIWDLMYMHHALDPVDDHDLGYMKSVLIRGEYHKDEAKDPKKIAKYNTSSEAMDTYCGMDNTDQREIWQVLHDRLAACGRLQFYLDHYAALIPSLLAMTFGGIRTDAERRALRQMQLKADIIELQDKVTAAAGRPLHTSHKTFSTAKVKKYIYEDLQMPPPKQRGRPVLTTNEIQLRKFRNNYPQRCAAVVDSILETRRKQKLVENLSDAKTDPDGYMRAEYVPTTEAGRLASRSNPWRTGRNLQNVDKKVRDTFIPDPGHVFLEVDESQAESRVVYVLSGDPTLIELARRHPSIFDQHTYNAHRIFGIPESDIVYDQRQIGKKTVHGAQRGMRGDKLSGVLLKDGYVRSAEECQAFLDSYMREHPGMDTYFRWIRDQTMRNRYLANSWGRVWDISFERLGDDVYRRAYSFLPQSEVGDLLKQWGQIPAHALCAQWGYENARLAAQVHDSVLISLRPECVYPMAVYLQQWLERPRVYQTAAGPVELTIPVTFTVGHNWAGQTEWKVLPSEGEVTAEALRLLSEGQDEQRTVTLRAA